MHSRIIDTVELVSSASTRLTLIENTLGHFGESLRRIENHLNSIDKKFEHIDKKFEAKFSIIENRLWILFFWTSGGFVGVSGLIAHAVHWF